MLNEFLSLFLEHNEENGDQSERKNPELNVLERLLQPASVCIVRRKPLPGVVQQFDIRRLRKEHPLKILQRAGDGKNAQVAFLDNLGERRVFNLRRFFFQSGDFISESAAAFNHDNRPVPPDTLQQLVFGNGTAIDQNREHRNIERSGELEKRFRFAAPFVAIYKHEMRMVRIQRRAVIAGDWRTTLVSHFPRRSDA